MDGCVLYAAEPTETEAMETVRAGIAELQLGGDEEIIELALSPEEQFIQSLLEKEYNRILLTQFINVCPNTGKLAPLIGRTAPTISKLKKLVIIGLPLCVSAATSTDFIFVAEVPVYTPFQTELSADELLSREQTHFTKKLKRPVAVSDRRTYVIREAEAAGSKPWRGAVKLYGKERDEKDALNITEDVQILIPLIELFETEAFSTIPEESRVESAEKLRLILLANRMKSIFAIKNQSLKIPHRYENTLVLKGSWEPVWCLDTGKPGKHKYISASLKQVRQYMRMCVQKAMDASLTDKEREAWRAEIEQLIGEEKKFQGMLLIMNCESVYEQIL